MTPQHVWMIYYYAFHVFLVLYMVRPLLTLNIERENPNVCDEGTVKSDPEDCASYYQCLDGEIVKQKCHSECYFDSAWDVCVIDSDGVCTPLTVNCTEGNLEENPANSCGYFKCLNGSLTELNCTSGSYFNSTVQICLIDDNGVCSSISEECKEGGIEENPEDTCGYLKCVNGSLSEVNCTSGSYFNSTLQICLIDENGVCSSISEECKEGEIEENPEDTCGYLKCVNGSLSEVNCTSGSYFNSTLQICLIDDNGVCSSISEECKEGEIEANPEDTCGYLKCVNGSLSEVNCTSGSYFNSTLQICLIDENGVCSAIPANCVDGEIEENPENSCGYLICKYGSLSEVNCTSGSYFNSTLKTCLIDESGVCSLNPGSCIEDEIVEDPEECGGYLQCINGEYVNQMCSYGRYFHQTLKSCVIDNNGICTPLTETCEEGDREIDPEDCTLYLECMDSDFVAQKCAEGTYFNSSIKACVIDENCVCIPQVE